MQATIATVHENAHNVSTCLDYRVIDNTRLRGDLILNDL